MAVQVLNGRVCGALLFALAAALLDVAPQGAAVRELLERGTAP